LSLHSALAYTLILRVFTQHLRDINNNFSVLNDQRYKGYRCESGMSFLKWKVTWNYAYSPDKIWIYVQVNILCLDMESVAPPGTIGY